MARGHGKLSALAIGRAKEPGLYADGGGLYLQVASSGATSWIYRYQRAGRRRYMGLGPVAAVGLAEARRKALAARKVLADGFDPIDEAQERAAAAAAKSSAAMTFQQAAERYIEAHRGGWRNPKHVAQWPSTLRKYVFPVFGDKPVAAVDVALVLQVLEPIWETKNETARRVRGRIEAVLDWAAAGGLRSRENPARWRGLLQHRLSRQPRGARIQHHPALDYRKMAPLMARLGVEEGEAARCLEFAILTGCRTSEAIGMRWSEVDLDASLWVVPPDRIKAGRAHRVPLVGRALELVRAQARYRVGEFVFNGRKHGAGLSNMALSAVLKRLGYDHVTVHGFRSSLRDWASEATNFPREVAEMALAHAVGDRVEAAYRRGDLLQKRIDFLKDWETHCFTKKVSRRECGNAA